MFQPLIPTYSNLLFLWESFSHFAARVFDITTSYAAFRYMSHSPTFCASGNSLKLVYQVLPFHVAHYKLPILQVGYAKMSFAIPHCINGVIGQVPVRSFRLVHLHGTTIGSTQSYIVQARNDSLLHVYSNKHLFYS